MDDAVGGSVGFLPAEGESQNMANNNVEEKIDLRDRTSRSVATQMEMNICKYLRRPESVKYTHRCICALCEGF